MQLGGEVEGSVKDKIEKIEKAVRDTHSGECGASRAVQVGGDCQASEAMQVEAEGKFEGGQVGVTEKVAQGTLDQLDKNR
eukprot:12963321-Alexandrium_andersonii.AAC.1